MVDPDFCISTPRLDLSYIDASNDAHCDFLVSLVNSPEMAHVTRANMVQVPDRATARTILSPMSEKQQKTGYGRYMISLRDSSIDSSVPFSQRPHREYIGHVSVQMGRHPDAPTVPDVGFALLARYHGKGYATEATLRLIQHFRETRQQEAFAGYTAPDNDRSNLLFARIGFEDRGVKAVRGIVGDGSPFAVRVWGLGLKGELEEFGI